jgi:uncharacterized protein YndB with AHSA1/START domain
MIELREEIEINKDAETVWKTLTDINSWRLWSLVIDRAVIYGKLCPETEFKCRAGQWDFIGTILEVAPQSRFKCRGHAVGLDVDFTWDLTRSPDGERVILTASIGGWFTRLLRRRFEKGFAESIYAWLYSLKTSLERGPEAPRENEDKRKPRFSKKKISLVNPLNMMMPNRNRRNEDEED